MAVTALTPADRIRELNLISKQVADMLKSAGVAINALTPRALYDNRDGDVAMEGDRDRENDIASHKAAFEVQSKAFYTNLQATSAQLRRQVYGLEEAGIITPEAKTSTSTVPRLPGANANQSRQPPAAALNSDTERIANGGLGSLDVGWLNSRGNKVAAEKEAEMMQQARSLLESRLSSV